MKKIYTILGLALICLGFVSCNHKETYRFLNEEEQISKIAIVSLTFDEVGKLIQTEMCKIQDIDAFLDDFRKIDCYTYYGDPAGVTDEGVEATVIKVFYDNKEYELINWNGQAEYTSERGFKFYKGYSVFDEAQFTSLMNKYIDTPNN